MDKTEKLIVQSRIADVCIAFKRLLDVVEKDSDLDEYISDDYPFHKSLDELLIDVIEWNNTMSDKLSKGD